MKILIAEDDPSSNLLLQTTLKTWDYDVVSTSSGEEAWEALKSGQVFDLLIIDWLMTGMDGLEICRNIRDDSVLKDLYVILLTAKNSKEDIVTGLRAGADDYIVKPFHREILSAKVRVAARLIESRYALAQRVAELEDALSKVKLLQGLLPICSYCKKIRDDKNYWREVEGYISEHLDIRFSHGVCSDCYRIHLEPQLEKLKQEKQQERAKR
jgi:CheY-like chemotaxis protein